MLRFQELIYNKTTQEAFGALIRPNTTITCNLDHFSNIWSYYGHDQKQLTGMVASSSLCAIIECI